MKIICFGGSGLLGTELLKLCPDMICPTHSQVDVTNQELVREFIGQQVPDIVINAAAITDNRGIEKNPQQAISVNITGAANISIACHQLGTRLVYISTDYVYKGDRGNYTEQDEVLPFNLYSWTKLGGECSVMTVKNHLIIRTSFGSDFTYTHAFTDKWSSKDYTDVIAPLILQAATSPLTGVLNLGTERKTLHQHASQRNPSVLPVRIEDTAYHTPYDTSLNTQKWIDYTGSSPAADSHTSCRVCAGTDLVKYLDLGLMPLANNLEHTSKRAKAVQRFPLQVLFCNDCGLSQLSVVINPEKMFSYYTYRSSINKGYVTHCILMGIELKSKYNLTEDSFMIDIAGNDGTLLKQFKSVIGLKVLNVDPASNLVAISEADGIDSVTEFWSSEVANKIISTHGHADLITGTNVFAHVNNIRDFLSAARTALNKEGVLVLEFPYLIDFIENMEFDTIYFEHVSYMSILPLDRLCTSLMLKIHSVQKQDIHGGTIRVSISHYDSSHLTDESVSRFRINERTQGYDTASRYDQWKESVNRVIQDFSNRVLQLKKQGYKIAAFAASAKGNTLLNCTGMNTDTISYIVDETPEKIGKYSPGTGIPIVHKQTLLKDPPQYLIILSWNFAQEIIKKCKDLGYAGKFIIPIPYFHEL